MLSHVSTRTQDISNSASFCIISVQFTETLSVELNYRREALSEVDFQLGGDLFTISPALGLEDCTWQQIQNDNAQNTNRQEHRCLDPFFATGDS